MVISCQECGKEVEESFQFCPFCGKKLIKPKICSNCGFKLKENFMFCPECGKKWDSSGKAIVPISKKAKETEVDERVEETKPAEKPKPVETVKSKATKPKMSLNFLGKIKRPGKKVLMIISVICIVLGAVAAVILFNPFDTASTNGGSSGGRTFSISIENTYDGNVYYYLKIGALRYGDSDSLITDGETQLLEIEEDSLQIPVASEYDITLYASVDEDVLIRAYKPEIAIGVTEYATFVLSGSDGIIEVNCTGSQ